MLAAEGFWEPSKEDEESLRALQQHLGLAKRDSHDLEDSQRPHTPHTPHSVRSISPGGLYPGGKDISIVQPPPLATPLPVSTLGPTVLPIELVQTLNHTFFLHLLATDPERVLPPGKSLLSMMSGPRTNSQAHEGELPKLEDRVKDVVHRAFWNEVLESLSDPSPATQLTRLQSLYGDLHAALKALLPRSHHVLTTLSSPLSPTSAPLRSAIVHLREILVALRERCSPARDAQIDNLIRAVDEPNQLASTKQLATLVCDTTRAVLELTEAMKEDLSQFVLGSMDEKDLKVMVTQQAMLREKALILRLWPPSRLEPAWKTWISELDTSLFPIADSIQPPHRRWALRLAQALGAGAPVSCPLPTIHIPGAEPEARSDGVQPGETAKPPNALPPPFFVTCPALLVAQNYLQALVITASLRSLVRLPARSHTSSAAQGEDGPASFTERIWTLLKASVEEQPGAEDTKVVNLADEVVHVRRACADDAHPCGPEEEQRLRAAVDRTLQPRDPVFLLLQKRLVQGLAVWLVSAPPHPDGNSRPTTPIHMQTGRGRPGNPPRLHLGLENPKSVFVGWERERGKPPAIKGFEDEVLVREVGETFRKVGAVVDWMDRVWQDLIETGEIGGPSEPPSKGETGTSGTARA
ncbi:hypothetical protein K466DRAFT_494521 [Polyporus arcularius HHB13444]|uniref:Uncharacterized protein n=1 Tax=Polyporus arcularius HHB13444 TaxID=1314778 RepID=A0A5C3PA79_9APHY|nr:hypothetical protein K466DRAFT_494521 [Polyporus arcularius HHB13444]